MGCEASPIRNARIRLGLSRDGLGRIIGVSGRTVSYWESGAKLPDPARADALRRVLGLSELDIWRALHHSAPKAYMQRKEKPW